MPLNIGGGDGMTDLELGLPWKRPSMQCRGLVPNWNLSADKYLKSQHYLYEVTRHF